eukprot:6210017-Pleurochrysis_carterae.AAC.2
MRLEKGEGVLARHARQSRRTATGSRSCQRLHMSMLARSHVRVHSLRPYRQAAHELRVRNEIDPIQPQPRSEHEHRSPRPTVLS